MLFSIEVTSTYYPLRNYWFAFVAATTGGTLFKILTNQIAGYRKWLFLTFSGLRIIFHIELIPYFVALLRAYLPTDYDDVIAKANFWEFLVFIAMGKIHTRIIYSDLIFVNRCCWWCSIGLFYFRQLKVDQVQKSLCDYLPTVEVRNINIKYHI